MLEDLYDAGADLKTLTKEELVAALTRRGLTYDRHLRHMNDAVLPWHVLNHVDHRTEQQLTGALKARESRA